LLVACPGPGPGPVEGLCSTESKETLSGDSIAVCEAAFSEAPLVRPPADSASKVYGGLARGSFTSRDKVFMLTGNETWLAAEISSNRYAYFVYLADVSGGSVTGVKPVARIDDRVFGRLLVDKVIEGGASARISDGGTEIRYDYLNPDIPTRIRFDAQLSATVTDSDTQFPRYSLGGRIENATSGTRASDGGCFPALTTYGGRSPVFMATSDADRVTLLRHPNMHGGGDDVFTLGWAPGISAGNNMGGGLFIPVSALLQSTFPAPSEAGSSPHGVPWYAPSTRMSVVTGGGATCP
jgi:hypothetical protein